jgi:hypothetical protein
MAQWILKEKGKVVLHRTLRHLNPAELSPSNKVETEKRSLFNVTIRGVLGDSDKYLLTKTGTKRMCQTTQGWKFLVLWANGTRQWIDLEILKESNPVQVAEYVIARNIARTRLCIVGPLCFEEARCNCFCCDYKGTEDKSQIWD